MKRLGLFLISASLTSLALAQGMMPGMKKESQQQNLPAPGDSVAISGPVSPALTIVDGAGKERPLLSYKAPLDLLVVGFFSPKCDYNTAQWIELRRLYEKFRGWRVAFIALSVNNGETTEELQAAMKAAGIPYDVGRDKDQRVAHALGINATPGIAIIDEGGYLRYRGPLHDAIKTPGQTPKNAYVREALVILVSHIDPLTVSQPDAFAGCPIQ